MRSRTIRSYFLLRYPLSTIFSPRSTATSLQFELAPTPYQSDASIGRTENSTLELRRRSQFEDLNARIREHFDVECDPSHQTAGKFIGILLWHANNKPTSATSPNFSSMPLDEYHRIPRAGDQPFVDLLDAVNSPQWTTKEFGPNFFVLTGQLIRFDKPRLQ